MNFEEYAAKRLAWVYENHDYERVLQSLAALDPSLIGVQPEAFGLEFLGARLHETYRIEKALQP